MKAQHHLLLIAAALPLTACSSLRVQVSVLNPEVVREMATNDRLARSLPSILAETDTSIAQFFAERRDIHGNLYGDLRRSYEAELAKAPSTGNVHDQLQAAVNSSHMPDSERRDYEYWEVRMRSATKSLQTVWPTYQTTTDSSEHLRLRNQLISSLDEREAIQDAANHAIANDFSLASFDRRLAGLPLDVQASLAKSIQNVQKSGQESVAAQATQLFSSGDIQHSPYVFYVAKADKEKWATKFDQTVGRGTFGNTDIAIKALAPGNFTIKGISFNPADVAATAAKVTSQTVLLAAQVAGVPVKLSGSPPQGAAGGALAQSSQALSAVLAENGRVDQRLSGQREAVRRIAAAVVNERNAVAHGTDAQRKASLLAIKAVYDSHASQLRVTEAK